MPLAAGVVAFVLLALVLPALIPALMSFFDGGQLQPLIEAGAGRPIRAASALGLVALVLGGVLSAWLFFEGRRVCPFLGSQATKPSRVAPRRTD